MSFKMLLSDRKFLVTGGALLLSLLLFVYFPSTDRLSAGVQSIIALSIFFLLFPLFYVRLILDESWRDMGLRIENSLSDWIRVSGVVAFCFLLFFFGLEQWPALREAYSLPFEVERSFVSFVRYELFLLLVVFFYEVFFRGFVMFIFLRPLGAWSILFQWLIFMLFLLVSGSFGMEQVAMTLFAPFAGWVAYRAQSIWYSFLASAFFLLLLDVFLLLSNR